MVEIAEGGQWGQFWGQLGSSSMNLEGLVRREE